MDGELLTEPHSLAAYGNSLHRIGVLFLFYVVCVWHINDPNFESVLSFFFFYYFFAFPLILSVSFHCFFCYNFPIAHSENHICPT